MASHHSNWQPLSSHPRDPIGARVALSNDPSRPRSSSSWSWRQYSNIGTAAHACYTLELTRKQSASCVRSFVSMCVSRQPTRPAPRRAQYNTTQHNKRKDPTNANAIQYNRPVLSMSMVFPSAETRRHSISLSLTQKRALSNQCPV
ncbi:hypothetical protein Mapa_003923 [Marchantia paleacea]|nr:hypothetical protein Mapa_003923 [Marchantia paleacea]